MLRVLCFACFSLLILQCSTSSAQEESPSIAFYAGFTTNAPVFGTQSKDYNLSFDPRYSWLTASLGLEKVLKKPKRSAFMLHLNYQPLPHGSMSITQSESMVNGIYTREFDSLIMKSDNVRLSLGIKHYFTNSYDGFYLQYNAGFNLIFNETSLCSCTRIESEADNYFSESGTYSSQKRKVLMPDLSLTFGYVFPINQSFAVDVGLDVGMPIGKLKYPYIQEQLPIASSRTKVMNLNGLFLTSLIEAHAKILFIK